MKTNILPDKFKKNILRNSNLFEFNKDLNVLSLFSGCGGMDLGFEGFFDVHQSCVNLSINPDWIFKKSRSNWIKLMPTRFKTIFANDIRPDAKNVWFSFFSKYFNAKKELFHLESIVDRVKRYWDGEKDIFPKGIDVITGGFPCQDFSISGKRKGLYSHRDHTGKLLEGPPTEENRGKLYVWMREVIDIIQPKVFIAENVKGVVSLGDVKETIQNDFKNIGDNGYLVIDGRVLNASEYGVPQSRERIFFIGFKKSALKKSSLKALIEDKLPENLSPFPNKTHSMNKEEGLLPLVSLKEIFKDLKEPDETNDPDQKAYSRAKWYGRHCQGNREIDLDKIGPTIRAEHHGNIEFRRLSQGHGGKNLNELNQGLIERRLTIRECCRIQTFPDNYKFVGNKRGEGISSSAAYKLIGNAIPPLLGHHLAKRLEKIWPNLFKK